MTMMRNQMKMFLPALLTLGLLGCPSNNGGTDAGTDGSTTTDGSVTPDGGTIPPVPTIGTQIDRLGRGTINVAVTNPFNLTTGPRGTGGTDGTRDAYNADGNMASWVTNWAPQIQTTLAIYDGADTVCGNQLLACGAAAGCPSGTPPAADRYSALAGVLADDVLFVDTSKTTCGIYLGVEAAALGLTAAANDCGGRTPLYDVVDITYTAATVGLQGIVDGLTTGTYPVNDNASNAETSPSLTTFPFLSAPNP
jgi:hypothetical protein